MEKDLSKEILSDITVFSKYAKYDEKKKRRELWHELVERNMQMHIKRYPQLKEDIEKAYQFVFDKKVLPSMRSLQFSGKPIDISPNRIYNCAYVPMNDWRSFSEIIFLLLGGTGIGFSVQRHHVEQLPEIRKPLGRKRRYLIGDSIEGWSDAIKVLMKSYFQASNSEIEFDYSDIRLKGAPLITSGGKAPGPQPLKECIVKIKGILDNKNDGEQLTALEVHDIVCHIADAVLAGGIRRAALISLFSADDEEMLSCKYGNWWELNPQRGRSNNSAVLLRHKITREFFNSLWGKIQASGSGEPGIFFTNDREYGSNPCCLVGDTEIETEDGKWLLEDLISNFKSKKEVPKVWTYNEKTGERELDDIVAGDLTRELAETIKIELENGKELRLTPDHKIFTKNRGWIEAVKLTEEDDLMSW